MSTYLIGLIRTGVPYLVGWLLSLPLAAPILSALGVAPADAKAQATAAVTVALGSAYYALARALEHRWPQFGVLLGIPAAPTYARHVSSPATPADLAAAGAVLVDAEPSPPAP